MTIAVGAVRGGERLVRALTGRTTATTAAIDYRFAALGSQVPDLIDKPLKYYLFPDSLPDSHIYGHTLLLPLCLILLGVVVARRYGDLRMLVLGVGCLTHPLVDPVQVFPKTLFWPLLGTDFPVAAQPWRRYFQIPLDIALVTTYALLIWRSELWRQAAWDFLRHGTFPGDDPALEAKPRYTSAR